MRLKFHPLSPSELAKLEDLFGAEDVRNAKAILLRSKLSKRVAAWTKLRDHLAIRCVDQVCAGKTGEAEVSARRSQRAGGRAAIAKITLADADGARC